MRCLLSITSPDQARSVGACHEGVQAMTRNGNRKRRIRTLQRETGVAYNVARRALADDAPPKDHRLATTDPVSKIPFAELIGGHWEFRARGSTAPQTRCSMAWSCPPTSAAAPTSSA